MLLQSLKNSRSASQLTNIYALFSVADPTKPVWEHGTQAGGKCQKKTSEAFREVIFTKYRQTQCAELN